LKTDAAAIQAFNTVLIKNINISNKLSLLQKVDQLFKMGDSHNCKQKELHHQFKKQQSMTDLSEEKPKIYVKAVVLIFSVLLSTLFGALLFAQNLKEIGKKKEIFNIFLFAIFWNTLLLKILGMIIPNPLVVYGITNTVGGLLLIFPFWNYYLSEIVGFDKRTIWLPLIFFIVLVGGFTAFLLLYHHR